MADDALGDMLQELKSGGCDEVLVLSTCNRTEIYVGGSNTDETGVIVAKTLEDRFGIDKEWLRDYTYTLCDEEAYKHLFLVASGLDSMVVGEPQILGQVKDAYRSACTYNSSGSFFQKVFHRAFQVAKRVRTETRIGYDPVSISSMAVELARKIFGEVGRKQILVIGAGEMCEVALKHFKKEGLQDILVTNRTLAKAQQLAEEIIGAAYPFEDIPELLLKADMVLSSTGADEPIIDKAAVLLAMKRRKNRPLFFIDIAVPRDIEPTVNDIENVYLYDIDDLKGLAQVHLSNRIQESQKAHAIVRRRSDEVRPMAQAARDRPPHCRDQGEPRNDEEQRTKKNAPEAQKHGPRDCKTARCAHPRHRQQDNPPPPGHDQEKREPRCLGPHEEPVSLRRGR